MYARAIDIWEMKVTNPRTWSETQAQRLVGAFEATSAALEAAQPVRLETVEYGPLDGDEMGYFDSALGHLEQARGDLAEIILFDDVYLEAALLGPLREAQQRGRDLSDLFDLEDEDEDGFGADE